MAGFQRLSSPSLTNRANAPIVDYTSIFSSFHSLKTPFNSIPVLHFPVLVEEDEASVVHAPSFDYSEIFGCFDADDFAVPYDQLFAQTSSANARSSVEMESQQQTPPDFMGITVERFEEEPLLCSDKNQLMTNEISHHKISEMNASYKQINKRSNEDSLNQTTHMVQLHEVTGYTFVVDACPSSQTIKYDKPPPYVIDDLSLKLYSKGGISEGENFWETVSCSAVCSSNDLKAAQEGSKFTVSKNAPASNQHHFHYSDDCLMSVVPRSYSADMLLTVSDIHLQTKPSQLPPPSRTPPKLVIKQDDSKKIMAANPRAYPDEILLSELLTKDRNCQSVVPSETTAVKGSAEDVLPPFFDIEIDARSATSAPAASMKEAMEKGQVRLKNERELIEIKSDNLQSDVKIGVDEDITRKTKRDGKIAHENHRVKELSPLEARECFLEDDWQKTTRIVQMDPDFREKGELFELSMPSLVRWKEDLEDFTTLASHKAKESRTGWKAERQFYELVKGEEFKCTDNVPELEFSQKKLKANLMVRECQLNVKKAAEEEAMPKKNEKSSKHVENGEKLEAAKEVHKLQENNNKLKSAQEDHILEENKRNLEATHECKQQEKKLKAVEEDCQGGGSDKELDAVEKTCNLEENWKEVKAAPVTSEQEEYDKKLKPSYNASSCEENKKTIKTATPLKEAVIKYKQDEHCKILKADGEVSELEGTEKKVKAVHQLYTCWDGIKAAENVIHDGEEEKVREAQETNKWAAIEKEIKVSQVASEWGNLTVAEKDREQMRELGEKKERENIFIRRATGETCNRAFMEAREREESFVAANITSISYRRALTEVQERTDRALEALERSSAENPFVEDRMREEDAIQECAAERVNDEAASETRERADGFITENLAYISRDDGMEGVVLISTKTDNGMKQSVTFLDTRDSSYNPHIQSASSSSSARGYSHSIHGVQGLEIESARRCQARLERHQRTIERAAKALAERKFRDILIQREQAERNRLAETLDADVRRWSNGKQGNLRALLSTLQYILAPESGWQPIPLTDVITAVAVKKAYRKAALCVHPDKVQQRGASIQQKYICEKVYDLLKEAWNKFNYEG